MHTLTRGSRALAAVGSALFLLIGIGLTTAPASAAGPYDGKTVIASGHTDVFFASQDDGKSVLQLKDDATVSPPEYGAPEDYVLHVKPSVAQRTANAFVADSIPGFTDVGDTIYVLPQNNRPGEIFAGWGHSLPSGSSVEYEVTAYEGPGNFATWQSGEDGAVPFLNQAAGIPTSFTSPANHEHKNWGFTEQGEYKLTVSATVTLPGGEVLEASDPATYTFWVGEELPEDEPIETSLSIDGLADEYEVGDVASLTAVQDPQTDEDHYHWFIKRSGDEDYSTIPGALSGSLEHTVTDADDGAQIKVELYDHDHQVIAASEPVTLNVAAAGEPPVETSLSIEGLADEYEVGDVASLTAVQDPQTDEDHYHWFIKRSGDEDYSVIAGALSDALEYTVAEGDDGAQIIARLYDHDHGVIAESEPVTLNVAAAGEPPVETSLSIEGLADEYEVGDVASLTAVQDPQTDEDHYHWFIKRSGDEDYSVIAGALSDALEYTVAEGDDGAQIIARLYDHDHGVIAESEPVTLNLATADQPGDGDDPPGDGDDPPGGDDQPGDGDDPPGGDDQPGDGDDQPGGGDDAPGDDAGKEKVSSPGKLPATGADIAPFAPLAALVLLLGSGAAFAARRRLAKVSE